MLALSIISFYIVNMDHEKLVIFLTRQERVDEKVKDYICHPSFELQIVKTTVKVHFVRAFCLGCVNLFSGLTL